jgi:hypothetical protein
MQKSLLFGCYAWFQEEGSDVDARVGL